MKTLYLGCIHLGNPSFKRRLAIAELLRGEFDKIILVGDIWDTWEGSIGRILNKYISISTAIKEISQMKEVILTLGNHDPTFEEIGREFPNLDVYERYANMDKTGAVMVLHGNEFDGSILRYDWLSKFLYYVLVHPFLRITGVDIRHMFKKFFFSVASRKFGWGYGAIVLDMERTAVEKYGRVIMAHTHMPKIVRDGETLYVNVGDWIHNNTYVIYDDVKDTYTLYESMEDGHDVIETVA